MVTPLPEPPNCDAEDLPPLPKPSWVFWLLLLGPILLGGLLPFLHDKIGAGDVGEALSWRSKAVLYMFAPVNLVCSFLAATHLSRLRTGQAQLGWLLIGTLLAFLMNAQLGYALAVLVQALTAAPPA